MQEVISGDENGWSRDLQTDLRTGLQKILCNRIGGGRALATVDEDTALVSRFLTGETAAFDVLFKKYQDYVYHIVYGIVGSAEEARDLTQDVFLHVYRSLHRFRGGSRFSTWLYRIAVNRAVDAARSTRRWQFIAPLDALDRNPRLTETSDEPEAMFERKLDRSQVQEVLMLCSLTHREVLVLRYYRELSVEEMAETLNCSVSATKVRLHRARAAFKAHYTARFDATATRSDRDDRSGVNGLNSRREEQNVSRTTR